ncbi:MAG: hypothetical protein KDK30_00810 [Leptospiraceae bacterium]|nr:hypothetical protein [Leptospiraceae bacterium]MCB1321656.1 hypothetical protein [Leptospiraceae bacterium]
MERVRAIASRLSALLLCGCAATHCYFINVGVRQAGTILIAVLGAMLLIATLKFLFTRLEKNRQSSIPGWLRFLTAVIVGILIAIA